LDYNPRHIRNKSARIARALSQSVEQSRNARSSNLALHFASKSVREEIGPPPPKISVSARATHLSAPVWAQPLLEHETLFRLKKSASFQARNAYNYDKTEEMLRALQKYSRVFSDREFESCGQGGNNEIK
jgi:hypothetical protein